MIKGDKFPGPKVLMLNTNRGFIGGVERLMVHIAKTLKDENWQVYGLFEHTAHEDAGFDEAFEEYSILHKEPFEELISYYIELGIDVVCIHKFTSKDVVARLQKHFRTLLMVHDHDYYCLRRHKYFPYRRKNCYLPFHTIYCTLCSGLIEKREGKFHFIDATERAELLHQMRQCDINLVLSEYMKHNLVMNGWDKKRIRLMKPYQPIPESLPQISNDIPVLLYVGQLIRGKGVDLLLSALAKVKVNFLCKIVGRGNDEEYLKEMISTLGLKDKVELVGFTHNVSQLYQTADIVVVPSRWQEPFGLVGLEAFAHQKPVIGFHIGGIPQWLKHKVNGLIVRAGDNDKLAEAIAELCQDKAKREKYGQAGFQMVKEVYNYEAYRISLIKPLEELIDGKL